MSATKIFLDSGDPQETREAKRILGFLDGQTTNPTLVSKNPEAKARLDRGEKFSREELLGLYKEIVREISAAIPEGSVSLEVYADRGTSAEKMLKQGKEMFSWIPNAHVKFPATREGLEAASRAVADGMRVNMTLCFSQRQAAAVYKATRGAERGQVYVSPFVGRLDDKGENGMELVKNILRMYEQGDGHVEVLAASVRNVRHIEEALEVRAHILTSPLKVLQAWKAGEQAGEAPVLRPIAYEELDLEQDWQSFDLHHELTDQGMERFSDDWKKLLHV